jgi:hypothetical protein
MTPILLCLRVFDKLKWLESLGRSAVWVDSAASKVMIRLSRLHDHKDVASYTVHKLLLPCLKINAVLIA